MFAWCVTILLFVASCHAERFYELTNNVHKNCTKHLPLKCVWGGRFPDPLNCRNSYTCEFDYCPFGDDPRYNCFYRLKEICECPNGTYWAGPAAECVSDPIDIKHCCNREVDCNEKIFGDNFGNYCPLTGLGYHYSCATLVYDWDDWDKSEENQNILVKRCKEGESFYPASSCVRNKALIFTNLIREKDSDGKPIKIYPVCKPVRNSTVETLGTNKPN